MKHTSRTIFLLAIWTLTFVHTVKAATLAEFMGGYDWQSLKWAAGLAVLGGVLRTIASLQNVQGARVHLGLARQSAFVSDRRPGSASVFLQIKTGRRLDDEQVHAIANLVASSIPEMQASQVTVVDQAGRLLSAPDNDSDLAVRDKMF